MDRARLVVLRRWGAIREWLLTGMELLLGMNVLELTVAMVVPFWEYIKTH